MSSTRRALTADDVTGIVSSLSAANADIQRRYPGESGRRQPVHVVYGGAHLFRADTARKLGDTAISMLEEYARPAARARHHDLRPDRRKARRRAR
jgi:hypothetical protein